MEEKELAEFFENTYDSDILMLISIKNGLFCTLSYGKNPELKQRAYHLTEVAKYYITREILGGAKA